MGADGNARKALVKMLREAKNNLTSKQWLEFLQKIDVSPSTANQLLNPEQA